MPDSETRTDREIADETASDQLSPALIDNARDDALDNDVHTVSPSDDDDGERAGIYLAILAALAVPSLIILALFLPNSPVGDVLGTNDSQTRGTGLDQGQLETTEDVPVEVAGAGARQDEITTEVGSAVTLENTATAAAADGAAIEATTVASTTAPPVASTAEPSTTVAPTTVAPTTIAPTTTATPTTVAPTTAVPTTVAQTTVAPTTSAEPEPAIEPAEFVQRVDVGRIGETTLQIRFSSKTATNYVVTVRSGLATVVSQSGSAQANQLVNETIQGLTAGTDYTVQVRLDGPPIATSPPVAFRTSGGDAPLPAADVVVQNLRLESTSATRFEVRYESNICANGSFVIREQGGAVVGSNAGQASGCTTRHLGIPGFWTPALKANTTYVITVQVEANGAGKGAGNTASRSLVVTTSA